MRGPTIVLLCALTLAKAGTVRRQTSTNNVNSDPKQATVICASPASDGVLVPHEHCNLYYQCWNGEPVVRSCSRGLHYSPQTEVCDWPEAVECGQRVIPKNSIEHDDIEEATNICSSEGAEDLLLAHKNCDKFYKCQDGKPVTYKCPGHLLYNSVAEYCDCASQVKCGDRVISGEDEIGSSGSQEASANGNNDPSEATIICAGENSDGVLVAHENCNKFYKCANGVTIEFECYGSLLFNPAKGHCEWPENVDCGDRLTPAESNESHHDSEENEDGKGSSQEQYGDTNTENGGSSTCNCNPAEAENICSSEGSDGTMIAHAHCDRFHKCNHGHPAVQRCPAGLLYNPYKEICDWPHNVDCGDRTITEDESQEDAGDNGNTDNGDPGNNSSENGGSGTCNCNPAEAENICSNEGSDGTLIAHAHCDRFHKCDHGHPAVQRCPAGLLYNPHQEICDWPHNVDCGDRTIPEDESQEDAGDNGNTDNGDSGNNSSENGGSGTCNCNPAEAENICSNEGSDGTLIAHAHCDRFHKCDHGHPAVQRCPAGLLYNPHQEICDWPHNVDCGDRTIPEDESQEDAGDNGNTDNGDSGNNSSENGGSGTCNCNPAEAENICSNEGSDGTLIAHAHCDRFHKCDHGHPAVQRCPAGLLYNPHQEICDWPHNVDCGDRTIPEDESQEDAGDNGNTDNGDSGNNSSENGGSGTCNCNPAEAENICSNEGSDGTLIAHAHCDRFHKCDHGHPAVQRCPAGLLYNPHQEICDWPYNVDCGDRTIPEDESQEDAGDNGNTDNGDSGNNSSENGGSGTCNCNPAEAENICSNEGSDGTLIAHAHCDRFHKCDHGHPAVQRCPAGLLYNPHQEICDWPHNVDCGDRTIPEDESQEDAGDNGNTDNGDSGNNSSENGGSGTCNCNPAEAENICSNEGSDGTMIAHTNCCKFYKCAHGQPAVQKCPAGLLYNPYKEICDWPHNVDCGDRTITEDESQEDAGDNGNTDNGDSGNNSSENGGSGTCNCNPAEAENICSNEGSDGTLIAHAHCDRFHKCDHGHPAVQRCPAGLLYNPHQEICDWPHNVDCGDRTIPEDESQEDAGDNGNTDNGDSGNNSSENGGSGTCNCNPAEAENICSNEGSDGTLIAHAHCDRFHKCDHGHPAVQRCPAGLLYNPHQEICDWPHNVDCGDRTIPEDESQEDAGDNGNTDNGDSGNNSSENGGSGTCNCNPAEADNICSNEGSDGTLIAHAHCDRFHKCDHGHPAVQRCPAGLLYNPHQEICDWPHNVDCGDRTIPEDESQEDAGDNGNTNNGDSGNNSSENGGSGTCNCNPAEAENICSSEGSDGTLIAHAHCDRFHKCDHGHPAVQRCPAGLLYNPHQEICDWPHNVDCGDRTIPEDESQEDAGDNGNTDNGDSGNNSSENGGSGTCNCNPAEAENICSSEGSDGTLIAHAHCDRFHKCDHGHPAVQRCPAGLLYNPHQEICDWPHNVDCGDRTIPEDESQEDAGDNGNTDNGDSGNNSSENGGSGTCNCNPAEAENICSNEGSDGTLIAHAHCDRFHKCDHGHPAVQRCPAGLLYNPHQEICDWPHNVDCGDRTIPEDESQEDAGDNGNTDNGDSGNNSSENGGSGTCNCNPAEAENICSNEGSDGTLIAHAHCDRFHKCDHGHPAVQRCPAGLLYNPHQEICDWPHNVDCGDRTIPEDESQEDAGDNGNTDNGDSGNNSSENGGSGTCNCNPAEAENICSNEGSDGTLIAHAHCDRFHKCDHGHPAVQRCPAGLLYNPHQEICDWPHNVDCGDRTIPEDESQEDVGDNGNTDNGDSGNNSSENGGTGTCNCNPAEAENICSNEGSDGTLIAHAHCDRFHKCDHGHPAVQRCPAGLLYNPHQEICDWPHNVDCGDRTITEDESQEDAGDNGNTDNGDSGNNSSENGGTGTCNCNPAEAENICSNEGADGTLIAHTNCCKFYKCAHGQPAVQKCPAGLLYNPYKEICDWPHNVDCGDRTITEDESQEDAGDNGNTDNGDSGNNSSENGGSGTCNCNPAEAENICSSEGSDGTLIAHAHCDRFHKCDHGHPAVQRCPAGLLYNPHQEICDWPHNVDCGDRTIPEDESQEDAGDNGNTDNGDSGNNSSENGGSGTCNCNPAEAENICSTEGSHGTLIAHAHCDRFHKCDHGQPVVQRCPAGLLYNPHQEICDWPHNVDCGDRTIPEDESQEDAGDNGNTDNGDSGNNSSENGGSGTCNCNPAEAENICSNEGSDGTLIAHAHCDRFHKCDHGQPVVQRCPADLLYNPHQEICDWPHNVDCGDRTIPEDESQEDAGDNGNTDNGDSGNNSSENGGTGTCNCNPADAENICSSEGSDGTLIAHEKCNKYYMCDHGLPVVQECPNHLMYNPYKEHCDWADNVQCGDRTLPEEDCNCEEESCNNSEHENGDESEDSHANSSDENNNEVCDNSSENVEEENSVSQETDQSVSHEADNGSSENENQEDCEEDADTSNEDGKSSEASENSSENNESEDYSTDQQASEYCQNAESNAVFLPHQNCKKFYVCVGNMPVVLDCAGDLFFNQYTGQCDLQENVDCKSRISPEDDIDNENKNVDSSEIGQQENVNEASDIDTEVKAYCALTNSEDNVLPHENCNEYYICIGGVPEVRSCSGQFLFNAQTLKCDWPQNVNCDRATAGGASDNNEKNEEEADKDEVSVRCSTSGVEGLVLPHENCNQYYVCISGEPVIRACSGQFLFNAQLGHCDWPQNVDCSRATRGLNNIAIEKSNPITSGLSYQTADIKCEIDSSGVTFPHEDCNKFYVCVQKRPIVFHCPAEYAYDVYRQQCYWSSKVDCNNRKTL